MVSRTLLYGIELFSDSRSASQEILRLLGTYFFTVFITAWHRSLFEPNKFSPHLISLTSICFHLCLDLSSDLCPSALPDKCYIKFLLSLPLEQH
jgi:hypothetical protein